MTKLSVNINKIALIRNARGGNVPDLKQVALDIESFGADGITVHPRPDERHIRYSDCYELRPLLKTEFNIEGYPSERWVNMVCEVLPDQATLVPDAADALTSDHGWDTIRYASFLKETIARLKEKNIRVSLFIDPLTEMIAGAQSAGADRIELYTGPYAKRWHQDPEKAIEPYTQAAETARGLGLGINAGHDLNLDNLSFFHKKIPFLDEVSIGHALISDALYFGLENVVNMYKRQLQ